MYSYPYLKLYLIFLISDATVFRYRVTGTPVISSIFKGFFGDSKESSEANELPAIQDPNLIDLSAYGRSMYGEPDFSKTGNLVAEFVSNKTSVNPEELGSYLEGDILIPRNTILLKSGLTSRAYRWPNGVVPFEVADDFKRHELDIIDYAIDQYHANTCVRFKPRTTESDYISLVRGNSGCWSAIGRVGGKQEVNMQAPACFLKHGTAIHELMHVLGFIHEQNRKERDQFVKIQFQNVQSNAKKNFQKIPQSVAFGVAYDYGSVMHYSATAFSSNGWPTIVPKEPVDGQVMGQRDGFSTLDIEKVNRMYNCKVKPKPRQPPIQMPQRVSSGGKIPFLQSVSSSRFGTLLSSIFGGFNRFGNFIRS